MLEKTTQNCVIFNGENFSALEGWNKLWVKRPNNIHEQNIRINQYVTPVEA
jgi:hypothetical protein